MAKNITALNRSSVLISEFLNVVHFRVRNNIEGNTYEKSTEGINYVNFNIKTIETKKNWIPKKNALALMIVATIKMKETKCIIENYKNYCLERSQ